MSKRGWLFVHSDLDDAGLDPEAFRVLAHIARRADASGTAFPSVKTTARVCRLNKDTVARRLRDLVAAGWIERVKRPGLASGYALSSTPPPIRREGISDAKGYPSKHPLPIRREGSGVIRREGSEGNPVKDIQEGNPNMRGKRAPGFDPSAILLPFQSEEFRTAWREWCQHLREKKKPLGASAANKQLSKLSTMGESRAIAAIDHSISNNWQGIFEPKAAVVTAATAPKEEW